MKAYCVKLIYTYNGSPAELRYYASTEEEAKIFYKDLSEDLIINKTYDEVRYPVYIKVVEGGRLLA